MRRLVIVCGISLSALVGCQKKTPVVAPPQAPAAKVEIKKIPFVPPADSSITRTQLSKYQMCNELLDSLSYLYADSFKTQDAARRLVYQQDFTEAQDRICVRAGLTGGYEEYEWILGNIGSPRNKAVVESLMISVK